MRFSRPEACPDGFDTLNARKCRFNVFLGHGFKGADTLKLLNRSFNV